MDLNTAQAVVRVGGGSDRLRWPDGEAWQPGDAWLAGGSWLFSEEQPRLRRLVDISSTGWPAVELVPGGLEIAATCTLAALMRLAPASADLAAQPDAGRLPADWGAARLIAPCCRSLRGSFKVWNVATVGGNLCVALPAGPMISLTAALDGVCTIWCPGGGTRRLAVGDFVLGPGENALAPGELLRAVTLPASALRSRPAFRQFSRHAFGRSAVLLIGRLDPDGGGFVLTVTAATDRPVSLAFAGVPPAAELRAELAERIAPDAYLEDLHGSRAWRAHLTRVYAEEIRRELAQAP